MTKPGGRYAQTTPAGLTAPSGVYVKARFGQLRVVKIGLRTAPDASHPRGWPAAECVCSCGEAGVIVANYRLLRGHTSTCGHGKCTLPRGSPGQARILAYLAGHGPVRLMRLAADLGMTDGAAGGQLTHLRNAGKVVRPFRGVWCLPGQEPDGPLPELPGRSEGARKGSATRWANATQADRDREGTRLAKARTAAAERRRAARDSNPAPPGTSPGALSG